MGKLCPKWGKQEVLLFNLLSYHKLRENRSLVGDCDRGVWGERERATVLPADGERTEMTETSLDLETDCSAARPTPEATIEAMSYALRDGLKCLADPANMERLRSIDTAGMAMLVSKLQHEKRIGVRWLREDVNMLTNAWRPPVMTVAAKPEPSSLLASLDNLSRANAAMRGE